MEQGPCAVNPFAVSLLDLAGELVPLATSMFRGTTGEAEALAKVTAAALPAPAHPETLAEGKAPTS